MCCRGQLCRHMPSGAITVGENGIFRLAVLPIEKYMSMET